MERLNKKLISPCGINCGLCLHYLREINKCPGCFSGRKVNQKCIKCNIKLCKDRKEEFCYSCDKFPCERLKRLDKRYREKYDVSVIENLELIRDKGMDEFIKSEKKRWQSIEGVLCMHDKKYY